MAEATKIKFGPHMAFGVVNMHEAAAFYQNVMGFKLVRQRDEWIELDTGSMRLFLIQDNLRQPTFELLARDPDQTVEFLEHHGCLLDEDLSAEAGEPILRDPYGYIWIVSPDPAK